MTRSEIRIALNAISLWLARGDRAALSATFDLPLPVGINDVFVVLRDAHALNVEIQRYLAAAERHGVTRFDFTNLDVEDCTGDRNLVRLTWTLKRPNGSVFSTSQMRCVLRGADCSDPPRIEMVEVINTSFECACPPDLPSVS